MPNENGLRTVTSRWPVKQTADRLERLVVSKGMTVFARIDHAANATGVGMQLAPMELLIFGGPKAGTVLMQDQGTCGIDLPVKALIWQDPAGKVQVTYNDAAWLAERHHLGAASDGVVRAIGEGLAGLVAAATSGNDSL